MQRRFVHDVVNKTETYVRGSWNALTNPTNNSMLTCPVVNMSVTSGTFCMNVTAIAIRNGKIIAYWQNGWKTADGNPLKDPQ